MGNEKAKNYNRNRLEDGTFTFAKELDQRQRDVICELIANGGNKTEACRVLGIPRVSLYRWLDNEIFLNAYHEACKKIYQDGLTEALNTMMNLMKCPDSRTALKAAEDIMKLNGYLDTKCNVSANPEEIIITLSGSDDGCFAD